MRILLLSDSHGAIHNIEKAISRNNEIDMIIHLGDYISDAIQIEKKYSCFKHIYVPGNNDWTKLFNKEKLLMIENKKIIITHGHTYNVKSGYEKLIAHCNEIEADAVFFGHTHISEELYTNHILLLNPGSIGMVAAQKPSYCLVEITEQRIKTKFVSI